MRNKKYSHQPIDYVSINYYFPMSLFDKIQKT